MNKITFINELETRLKRLPKDELEDAIQYYKEYFHEAGIDEEEDVLKIFDSPANIASQILSEYAFKEVEETEAKTKKGIRSIWFVVLAIFAAPIALPLTIAVASIVFAMVMVVISLIFTFLVVSVSLFAAGVFSIIVSFAVITQSFSTAIFTLGLGLMVISLGVLLAVVLKEIIPNILRFISLSAKKLLNKFINKNR